MARKGVPMQTVVFMLALLVISPMAACDDVDLQPCIDSQETSSASLNLLQTKMAVHRNRASADSEIETERSVESSGGEVATGAVSNLAMSSEDSVEDGVSKEEKH